MVVPEKPLTSDSFEELAMPLFDRLYNFAHWLTQNREEAEDLVQETFAKALKGFSSFQPGTNFRAWIYRILRNTFLTSRSGLKATATVPLDLEADEAVLPVSSGTPESIRSRTTRMSVPYPPKTMATPSQGICQCVVRGCSQV